MNVELMSKLKQELTTVHKKIIRDKVTQSMFGENNTGFATGKSNDEIIQGIDDIVNALNDALTKGGISCLESALKELNI